MFDHDLNLKGNELFLVGRSHDRTGMAEAGLYLRDTRFLSVCRIEVNNVRPQTLGVRTGEGRRATISLTNPENDVFATGPHTIAIEERVELSDKMTLTLVIENYTREAADLRITLDLKSDFLDMFAVRGWPGTNFGTIHPVDLTGPGVSLTYTAVDGSTLATNVSATPAPDLLESPAPGMAALTWDITVPPRGQHTIRIAIAPDPGDGRPVSPPEKHENAFLFWTSGADLQAFVDQAMTDLDLLQTTFPEGLIPAAGLPWYIAPFGRDSLIVALQTMHVYPGRIANTLRLLATHQGTKIDAFREEQPGKILHEMRYGELARSGQVPHSPYFGSIDSTPLFVMTFAQYVLWHRDEAIWRDLRPNVERALEWIETYGDLDGDGLIEFMGRQSDPTHISQQGWKDSHDSLHHADGSEVEGPIALVEVQGYVFAAYAWLAEAARQMGDNAWADALQVKADTIREVVESQFWIEREGYYAQALDGQKRRVDAISSNPGHLLFCALPSPERAALVAERIMMGDLYAGWGIRTLSSAMATYNPMSYHNGSIWPHDTSLAMWGLREYGFDIQAIQLAMGLVSLGYFAKDHQIAELYCGWPQEDHQDGPVDYPVSCIPQAWAAASAHLVIRTLLGIRPDFRNQLINVEPLLPEDFDAISVANLAAFGKLYDLTASAHDDHYHVHAEGDVDIVAAGGDHHHH
jgi:glycogen debranching enzyme